VKFETPEPLRIEHDELHRNLASATKEPGKIGEAARAVAAVLHNHFLKEEEYALPPLAILARVAGGDITPEMREVLAMTDKLRAELPHMLREHEGIVAALENLKRAAAAEHRPEFVTFAEKLVLHARTEELVMYPAALLVGEMVRARLG
jgi:Hemerythrin HHE cation binding domain